MSIVILDALENDNGMPETIKDALREMGKDISHFRLKDLNIYILKEEMSSSL